MVISRPGPDLTAQRPLQYRFFASSFNYGVSVYVFRFPQTSIFILAPSLERFPAKSYDVLSGYEAINYSPPDANLDILRPQACYYYYH